MGSAFRPAPGEDPSSEIFLYADDSKIYKVIQNQSDQQKLQSILNLMKNWSDEWLLRLHIDKCKSVSYCIKHSINTSYHIMDIVHQQMLTYISDDRSN